jgi:hypothetical protein
LALFCRANRAERCPVSVAFHDQFCCDARQRSRATGVVMCGCRREFITLLGGAILRKYF